MNLKGQRLCCDGLNFPPLCRPQGSAKALSNSPMEVPPICPEDLYHHQKHILYVLFHCERSRIDVTVPILHKKKDLRFKSTLNDFAQGHTAQE